MAERRSFLLRLDPETLAALQAWAADDLRSVNGQIEFLLRRSLREAGRDRGTGPVGKAAARARGAPAARKAAGDVSSTGGRG